MKWNRQQETALSRINSWLKDESGQQIFRLFGYAGTGKTTLAKHLVEACNHPVFCAFSGKAAHVLKKKGCPNTSTIHSLIYNPNGERDTHLKSVLIGQLGQLISNLEKTPVKEPKEENLQRLIDEHVIVNNLRAKIAKEEKKAKIDFALKDFADDVNSADIIVVDECSMVGEDMANDLLSFGKKVLVLGDPFQLPPVGNSTGFFTNAQPDYLLDEVVRQAGDSPVLELATRVRKGEKISLGDYGSSRVITASELNEHIAMEADQILLGTNKKRKLTNIRMRELLGFISPIPVPKERVICLRNNKKLGILNGATYEVLSCAVDKSEDNMSMLEIKEEGGNYEVMVPTFLHHFQNVDIHMGRWEKMLAEEFDYAYAVTVHKFQGSQATKVLLFDQSSVFRKSAAQWLYTGITRAEEQVIIVK